MTRDSLYFVMILGILSACVRADWKADVGANSLSARLGPSTPTGVGIAVTQVEACEVNCTLSPVYHPNEGDAEYSGKTLSFSNECATCDNSPTFSGHADRVAGYYYGNTNSMAPGIGTPSPATVIGINEGGN